MKILTDLLAAVNLAFTNFRKLGITRADVAAWAMIVAPWVIIAIAIILALATLRSAGK